MDLFLSVAFCLLFACNVVAQNVLPRNFQYAAKQQTRTLNGTPGTHYWQNTADYNINIKFNPKSRKLVGTETITYYNNSPDTLKMIVMSLYPNFYKKGVERNYNGELNEKDFGKGVTIHRLMYRERENTQGIDAKGHYNIQYAEDYTKEASRAENLAGTWLYIKLKTPILPGERTSLAVSWHYVLNKGSHVRTGEIEPGSDFVAYCYPRVAVYDDIDGWNRNSYKGAHEFYNDFCNYDVTIQLPKGYLCWATGELENRHEVFPESLVKRRDFMAEHNAPATLYDPTDANDVRALATQHKKLKSVKWHFKAGNVTDFAWACSNHYKWVSTSAFVGFDPLQNAQINVAYNPKHKDYDSVVYYAQKTIELLSNTFPAVPYPYPHVTVFDGLDQMEYPMMVNDNPLESREETIELVTHEVAHQYMPFIAGCNETKYAWMDEGWATYCEHIFTHLIDTTLNDSYGLVRFRNFSASEYNQPLSTVSTKLEDESYFINAYAKPGTMMHVLEQTMGTGAFRELYKGFVLTWQGKHPTQYDWMHYLAAHQSDSTNIKKFVDRWFYAYAYPDYKLSFQSLPKGSVELRIENVGTLSYPLIIEITYADKRVEKFWSTNYFSPMKGDAVIQLPFPNQPPQRIRIYNPWVLDLTPLDNEVKF